MSAASEALITDEAIVRFLSGLWGLNRRMKQDIEPRLERHGLDLRRLFILTAVRKGASYPKELSERLHIPSTLLSRYLDGLTGQGYLERHIDTQDSRRTRLSLTPAGVSTLDAAVADIKAYTSLRLQDLDPQTLTALLSAMDTLGNAGLTLEKKA